LTLICDLGQLAGWKVNQRGFRIENAKSSVGSIDGIVCDR
jgi:hypothetical protein